MENQPNVIVVQQSNIIGILAIVFAILGIFFLGFVFVPLAFLLDLFATYKCIKKQASIIVTAIAWILTFIALATSPVLLTALGLASLA